MKCLTGILMIFCLMLIWIPCQEAGAADAFEVSADASMIEKLEDETWLVPVMLYQNQGIMGFRITFSYDRKKINILTVSRGTVTETGNFVTNMPENEKSGRLDLLWNDTEEVQGDGSICYLAVKSSAEDSEIRISYSQPDTFNEAYRDVSLICKTIRIRNDGQDSMTEQNYAAGQENPKDQKAVTEQRDPKDQKAAEQESPKDQKTVTKQRDPKDQKAVTNPKDKTGQQDQASQEGKTGRQETENPKGKTGQQDQASQEGKTGQQETENPKDMTGRQDMIESGNPGVRSDDTRSIEQSQRNRAIEEYRKASSETKRLPKEIREAYIRSLQEKGRWNKIFHPGVIAGATVAMGILTCAAVIRVWRKRRLEKNGNDW